VAPLPTLLKNNTTFIYANTSNYATSNVFTVPYTDINLTPRSNIIVFNENGILPIHTLFKGSNVEFKIDPTKINNTPGSINTPYTFDFSVTNTATRVNPLINDEIYTPMFVKNHTVYLNQHTDSNIILPGQENNQAIIYYIDNTFVTYFTEQNHTTVIHIQVWPFPSLEQEQVRFLYDNTFTIRIADINDTNIVFARFTTNTYLFNVRTTGQYGVYGEPIIVTGLLSVPMDQTNWNKIRLVNYDPQNMNNL
jgi:hypothetical protein